MLNKEELLKNYNLDPRDPGSSAAQLVLLQASTNLTIAHLRANRKDIPAKRAMLKKLARQKCLLSYLKKHHYQLYLSLSKGSRSERKAAKVS